MTGHYLKIIADVSGRGVGVTYEILGGVRFEAQARKAMLYRTALVIPVAHPQALHGPITKLVRGGMIHFPQDSIRDVRVT